MTYSKDQTDRNGAATYLLYQMIQCQVLIHSRISMSVTSMEMNRILKHSPLECYCRSRKLMQLTTDDQDAKCRITTAQ